MCDDLLARFLYCGDLFPVHVENKSYVPENLIRKVIAIIKKYDADTFLNIIEKVYGYYFYLPRNHELWCSYAAYLCSSEIAMTEKEKVKIAFPKYATNAEDLFLFVYYAKVISTMEKKKTFTKTIKKTIICWYKEQSTEKLLDFIMINRGLHGFQHKDLIQICHINLGKIGKSDFGIACFMQCHEIVKNFANTPSETLSEPMRKLINICNLKITESEQIAIDLINENNLKLEHVPMHFLKIAKIWESFVTRLTYRQLLENMHFLGECKMFGSNEPSKKFNNCLEDQNLIASQQVHPIKILIEKNKMAKLERYSEKVKRIYYAKKVQMLGLKPNEVLQKKLNAIFHNSFAHLQGSGIRMLITINLQESYQKKRVSTNKQVTCYEAALTLAYSFFIMEKVAVQVYTYTDNPQRLQRIPWKKDMSFEQASYECAKLTRPKNFQRPDLPFVESFLNSQEFDLFLTIVPSIARGNPKNRPNLLLSRLKEYRRKRNPNARLMIVNLRRFKPALIHAENQDSGILEVCNFNENTPKFVTTFGLHFFP